MAETDADRKKRLVFAAITVHSKTTGCFEWTDRAARSVRVDDELAGITPTGLKELIVKYITTTGMNSIDQKEEYDDTKMSRIHDDFIYQICFPIDGFQKKYFVKMKLVDDDEDCPSVDIVGSHFSST